MSPWTIVDHGIDAADEGGRQVWRFRPDHYGVVAMPITRTPQRIEIDAHTAATTGDPDDLDAMARSTLDAMFVALVAIGAFGLALLGIIAVAIRWILGGFGG